MIDEIDELIFWGTEVAFAFTKSLINFLFAISCQFFYFFSLNYLLRKLHYYRRIVNRLAF